MLKKGIENTASVFFLSTLDIVNKEKRVFTVFFSWFEFYLKKNCKTLKNHHHYHNDKNVKCLNKCT